ncbi:MAG: hypothetical protein CMD14_09210 [Flavobacteriales bacterium]|nr:hypothetical protein [Flavobacteriales bacterium]|tara:strand:+ start:30216 stop:31109 length:894 start_codon:yes stop_codon:yes gene_type:complete
MPGRQQIPSFKLPSGTTAERDGSYNLTTGSIFLNTDTSNVEIRHRDSSNTTLVWRDLVINNKEQIDISGSVRCDGSLVVTGDLTINSSLNHAYSSSVPDSSFQLTNKQYVDEAINTAIQNVSSELTRVKSIMANVQEVVYKGNKDLNNASNDNEWQSISEMTADLTCVSGNSSLLVSVYLNASLERSDAPLRIRLYYDKDDSGSFSVLNSTLANSNGSNRMRSSFAVETDTDYGVSTGSISALIQGVFDNDNQKITIRLYYNIRDYDARLNRSEYSDNTNRATLTCSSIILQEIFVS